MDTDEIIRNMQERNQRAKEMPPEEKVTKQFGDLLVEVDYATGGMSIFTRPPGKTWKDKAEVWFNKMGADELAEWWLDNRDAYGKD